MKGAPVLEENCNSESVIALRIYISINFNEFLIHSDDADAFGRGWQVTYGGFDALSENEYRDSLQA